jgi:predicted nucleotidyltransferase
MNNNFGLTTEELQEIAAVINKMQEVDEALVFGSRAKGNYQRGSDVDIALKGNNLDHTIISQISFVLNEETFMPYHFDILNYNDISNKELLSHIDRVGQTLYKKNTVVRL